MRHMLLCHYTHVQTGNAPARRRGKRGTDAAAQQENSGNICVAKGASRYRRYRSMCGSARCAPDTQQAHRAIADGAGLAALFQAAEALVPHHHGACTTHSSAHEQDFWTA